MLNVPMSEKLVPQISEGSHGSLLGGDTEQSLIESRPLFLGGVSPDELSGNQPALEAHHIHLVAVLMR